MKYTIRVVSLLMYIPLYLAKAMSFCLHCRRIWTLYLVSVNILCRRPIRIINQFCALRNTMIFFNYNLKNRTLTYLLLSVLCLHHLLLYYWGWLFRMQILALILLQYLSALNILLIFALETWIKYNLYDSSIM